MGNLSGSIKHYGLVEGLSLYLKLKNFQIDTITTSKLDHEVHLRPGSTDNCVFKQIFLKQDLNVEILNNLNIETILDLGANIGMSSLYFANRFPDAQIIGVEPDQGNGHMFKKNLAHYPNVHFLQKAVRGKQENIEILDNGRGESGYEVAASKNGLPAVTISNIMKKYNWESIDILKMDIEGSEHSVLESNFEEWLPKTKVLFIELHEHKSPGCTSTLRDVLQKYDFDWNKSGEYEVIVNKNIYRNNRTDTADHNHPLDKLESA